MPNATYGRNGASSVVSSRQSRPSADRHVSKILSTMFPPKFHFPAPTLGKIDGTAKSSNQERHFMATFQERFPRAILIAAVAVLTITCLTARANAQMGRGTAFCQKLFNPNQNPNGKTFASQGAQMYCFGAQLLTSRVRHPSALPKSLGKNVNAADPSEDISPNGTRAYGQSETSIAAINQFVVEAWNDSTGFFAPCPSPNSKEELTGFSFSSNGGKSFTDLGGLPNVNCATSVYEGDSSVEAWEFQGQHYFYISSLFATLTGGLQVAVTACNVVGSSLSCGQPTIVATSPTGTSASSALDKDFMAIDPMRGRLYISYTDFDANDSIALAACDLTSNPMQPACSNGSGNGPIYLVVAPPDPNLCENEGAYPAVDVSTGDVYVAYEHNWPSEGAFGTCTSDPAKTVLTYIPNACLTLPGPSSCTGPFTHAEQLITSMSGAFVPGYNRFPINDFPRIAVSSVHGTVSMVWNDARFKPSGDILLESFALQSLAPVQISPVVVDNSKTAGHGWQLLPATRNTDDDGNLYISWYGRKRSDTAVTNVFEAVGVNPRRLTTPPNILVTTAASDWNAVSSDIVPNFGDYTDNYVGAVGSSGLPFTGETDFTAWSDGRLGDPQPFEAHLKH
jgi:hypothetical protein